MARYKNIGIQIEAPPELATGPDEEEVAPAPSEPVGAATLQAGAGREEDLEL
jgi:hypothetical protein